MKRSSAGVGTAFGPSLLARVRQPELARSRREPTIRDVRESILEHLRRLCFTHASSALAAPDYGLPDIGESMHTFPHAVQMIGQALTALIKKYEPRLVDVRVQHVPSADVELFIRYSVTAQLALDRNSTVAFDTRIDASRRVLVT